MYVLVTYRDEENQMKNEGARVVTTSGLENSTRPLVFTSASGCRASEYFDISAEN